MRDQIEPSRSLHRSFTAILIASVLLAAFILQSATGQIRPGGAVNDPLPVDFPSITVNAFNDPAPGELFLAPFIGAGSAPTNANYLIILDNSGAPLAYRRVGLGLNPFPYMFKPEPNGTYSYIDRSPITVSTHVNVMDTLFNVIDTYPKGDPNTASHADFHLLPNGHALALYFDKRTIDMSRIVRGGHPAASVQGTLIREYDLAKHIVFEWSSFDHQAITDTYEDTLAAAIDYSHANNITQDTDGNILISSRHISEITKIDRNTGEIIWRLGGKHNEFTFINEHEENRPLYFSYQHHIQRLPNGNITFFDNGNQRSPQYSRAVEYKLDEVNKTATLVWEYRHTPDIFASAQGSVQRLPNGNTLIGWGDASVAGGPSLTEIHPDKSIAFELTLPKGNRSMQVLKFPWRTGRPVSSHTRYELLEGNTYSFNGTSVASHTGATIKFTVLTPHFYNSATIERYAESPFRPQFTGTAPLTIPLRIVIAQTGMVSVEADVTFDLSQYPEIADPGHVTVFRRDTVGRGCFTPLPTAFNPILNTLTASTPQFGEFIFCRKDPASTANSPLLLEPADGDSLDQSRVVKFTWTPRGYSTDYHLQVSHDASFQTRVIDDSLVTEGTAVLTTGVKGTKYFWRVRARNAGLTSSWSAVRSFTLTTPYISITAPETAEAWKRGYRYFIKWKSNSNDRVRIDLLRGETRTLVVKDSAANTGVFEWSIPATLEGDTTYRFRITSVADSSVFGLSRAMFTITSGLTGIETDKSVVPHEFGLDQNFPNPFNPVTEIRFRIPVRMHASLKVYTVLGCEIATLVDAMVDPGVLMRRFDASRLPSGVYFYTLRAGRFTETKKCAVVK
ncbi:MAG TPA: aryl-sulfate sulfotransferase [Bacteroidota bacterium]|nr:aryl-sulfate sulfotransferase [Bacteroidota bacterium]